MPEPFWIDEYKKKAALADAVAQSGRGRQFEAVPFLHVVAEVLRLVEPRRDHDVLDVGCANGLMDVILAASCRSLLALDPVPEQVERAREHLAGVANVRVEVGDAARVPAPESSFDRLLLFGVLQLIAPGEVRAGFRELCRVARPGARLVIGSIPDGARKDAFLGPYLEGVREAAHLSDEQKRDILRRNEAAHWYPAEELIEWWRELGGRARVQTLSPRDPDHDHRYHLVVELA